MTESETPAPDNAAPVPPSPLPLCYVFNGDNDNCGYIQLPNGDAVGLVKRADTFGAAHKWEARIQALFGKRLISFSGIGMTRDEAIIDAFRGHQESRPMVRTLAVLLGIPSRLPEVK